MRKFLIVLLLLLIVAIAGYFVFSLNHKIEHNRSSKGINAIPHDAAAVLRIKDPFNKWEKLSEGTYGKQFTKIIQIKSFGDALADIQQAGKKHPVLTDVLTKHPVYLSAHMTGVQSYNFLLVSNFDSENKVKLKEALSKELKGCQFNTRNYEQCELTTLHLKSYKKQFHVAFEEGLILVSTSSILLEDAILQLKHRTPLDEKKEFAKLFKTADLSLDANLFINYSEFGKLAGVFGTKTNTAQKQLQLFGHWMEVDLKISDKGIMMNGFSSIKDSSSTFLGNLKNLPPSKIGATSVVPDNVSFMSALNFDHYSSYRKNFKEYLSAQQKLYQHEKNISNFNKAHQLNLKEDLFKWIGSEFCFFITQGDQENPMENACVAIQTTNVELASEKLKKISHAVGSKNDSTLFSNHVIYNLGLPNLLKFALGDYFNQNNRSHYTILEDYVVFGNDVGNLKNVINSYVRRKTLVKDKDFNQFYDHFNDKSNYFVYFNPKKAKNFWNSFLTEELAKVFNENQELINEFEAIGFQVVSHENLYFTNVYSNYKVIEEPDNLNLVTFELDTSYSKAPWLVKNHYTDETEILLQDDRNTLYLINNVGVVLWKKSLQEKIIGDIHLVDKFRNKKHQYLFGTGSALQLIDRNGQDVKGYPVTLEKKQTKGIAVLDYDKTKKYRVLVPAGNHLISYDKNGKKVKGWKFKSAKAQIANTPQLLQVNKKDYLIFNDISGKVYTLNRKGEERIKYHNTLPKNKKNYEIYLNGTLSNSGIVTTDTSGTVIFLKMNDEITNITTRNFTREHAFSLDKLSKGPASDLLYYDEQEVYAYQLTKNKILNIKGIDFEPSFGISTHTINKQGARIITLTDRQANKIYAYDKRGKLLDNFPVEGNSEVLVADINDNGTYKMIIGNQEGYLFIYTIF